MKTFFTSDYHLGDEKILSYLDDKGKQLRPFKSLTEMENTLINNYNSTVQDEDTCYFLGDMHKNVQDLELIEELNGRKILIGGNHDVIRAKSILRYYEDVQGALVLPRDNILATHYPVHCDTLYQFNNVHGHCVDKDTEILTLEGFKSYNEIKAGNLIYSFNPETLNLESDEILSVILKPNYKGTMYHLKARGVDMLVTNEHRIVFSTDAKSYLVETAEKALSRYVIELWKSFDYNKGSGIEFSDDMLKLYIALAADGRIENKDLGRFHFRKPRKVEFIESLLNALGIAYRKAFSREGTVRINFTVPSIIMDWNIKGLDKRLLGCNKHQCSVILATYMETDGWSNNIFTSKKSEVEILQHMFVLNGYSVKVNKRAKENANWNTSYILSISNKKSQRIAKLSKKVEKIDNWEGLVWCINTKSSNENFIARRNGSVFLTGNCHHKSIKDPRYYNVSPEVNNYHPVDLEDIIKTFKSNNAVYI